MASSTAVTLTVAGADRTRAVFATVGKRLAALGARTRMVGASIARNVGGALTAAVAGAGAGIAAIRASANALGQLSDRAAQAGVSARELNGLVVGLGIAGAKGANLETVAEAMSRMTRATGATGIEGLTRTLEDIAAIGDEQGRVAELSRVFGRSFGPGMAALVRKGPEAVRAGLQSIIDIAPRLDDRIDEVGDSISDSMSLAAANIRAGWHSAVIEMTLDLSDRLGVSASGVWAGLGAWARYGIEVAARAVSVGVGNIVTVFANLRTFFGIVFGEEGLGGIVARNLEYAWHSVRAFGQSVVATLRAEWDMLVGLISGEEFSAALEGATDRLAEQYADINARRNKANEQTAEWYAEASIASIATGLSGMLEELDTSDLRAALDETLARYRGGALDAARNIGSALANGANAVDVAVASTRQLGTWVAYGSNAARKIAAGTSRDYQRELVDVGRGQLGTLERIAGTLDTLEAI